MSLLLLFDQSWIDINPSMQLCEVQAHNHICASDYQQGLPLIHRFALQCQIRVQAAEAVLIRVLPVSQDPRKFHMEA